MRNYIDNTLKILNKVFDDGSYINRALSDCDKVDNMTTKLVYGVLERNVYIEFTLNQLLTKKPQREIYTLLKIGAYALENLDNVPTFAIVSECVEVAKMNGKTGLSGFVNAVLKKYSRKEYSLPRDKNSAKYLSVTASVPLWFVNRIQKEYGIDADFFAPVTTDETARVNYKIASLTKVKGSLTSAKVAYKTIDGYDALLVPADEQEVKKQFVKGYITFQALSSQTAVKVLNPEDGSSILDMCSAPGGKAVYIAELCPKSTVIASDLYAHRVELIKKYANRMQIHNVETAVSDATKFNPAFEGKFDYILLDAPCSCFGTYRKHPDVFLQRGESSINGLVKTQIQLLNNAVKYLKKGGKLVYSTCTLFDAENVDVVMHAVDEGTVKLLPLDGTADFSPYKGCIRTLPHGAFDGFFIAKLEKL